MTKVEHSRLLYLLDAIESSRKASTPANVLKMVRAHAQGSPDYDAMLSRLEAAYDVRAEAAQIREELR